MTDVGESGLARELEALIEKWREREGIAWHLAADDLLALLRARSPRVNERSEHVGRCRCPECEAIDAADLGRSPQPEQEQHAADCDLIFHSDDPEAATVYSCTCGPSSRPASQPEQEQAPPSHLVELAVQVSGWSPCRSKRGSVIFDRDGNVIAHGHNYKPQGFECDGSATCKATCRVEAIHAEQRALLEAGSRARGAEMLHAKSVDGNLVPSGGPSCVQCSKLALVAGVNAMWLYHEGGWRRYPTDEWHRLSLASSRPASVLAALKDAAQVAHNYYVLLHDDTWLARATKWDTAIANAEAQAASVSPQPEEQKATWNEAVSRVVMNSYRERAEKAEGRLASQPEGWQPNEQAIDQVARTLEAEYSHYDTQGGREERVKRLLRWLLTTKPLPPAPAGATGKNDEED